MMKTILTPVDMIKRTSVSVSVRKNSQLFKLTTKDKVIINFTIKYDWQAPI